MHTEQSLTQPSDPSDVILTISGVSTDGRGIAKTDNRAVFLERCLPGDIVRGRLNWTTRPPTAQVIEYTTHSPDRVPHPCPHAADCPACPFGEWDYQQQLAAKTDLVRRTLSKQLGECEVREIIASPEPWHYRSRVSLRLEEEAGRLSIGYRQGPRASAAVSLTACKLAAPEIEACIGELQQLLDTYRGGTTDKLPVRIQLHSTAKGTGMMMVFPLRIHASQRKFWRNWLTELNLPGGIWFATGNRAGALGAKSWIEADQGAEQMLTSWMGTPLKVHPGAFCQANKAVANLVSKRISVWSQRHNFKTIWDLYGGYGSLGFAAGAKQATVRIIEASKWSQPIAEVLVDAAECRQMKFYTGDVLK
ncbi:hypothetical protein KKG66_08645, partial [bacterium]|nr:hypothetical protein [bacterium]